MPSLVLDNAVQVRLLWTFNGVEGVNVLGGQVGGGFINSQAHANALATAVAGHYTTSGLKALHATSTWLNQVGIRDLRVANQVEYVGDTGTANGTGSAEALPNQIAAVATLRTALAGKSYRGRVYIGGADEDQNGVGGIIESAYNVAIVAFLTGVKAAMLTEGITMAVLSRPRSSPPFPFEWGGAVTPVQTILTRDTKWDTQRRRRD